MFRRFRMEFRAITDNISFIILGAFLCAMGGVILWVNGGSSWYVLRGLSHSLTTFSLSGIFIVWLMTYGAAGALLSLIWIAGRWKMCRQSASLLGFALVMLSYLLMLTWYAVFFCTRMTAFALMLLSLSVILFAAALVLLRKTMIIIVFVGIIVELVQIYYIYFSFAIFGK